MIICDVLADEFAERSRTERDPAAAAQFATAAAHAAAAAALVAELRVAFELSRFVDAIEKLAESISLVATPG
jgi:predicted lipid-binding transport protein (Tim44 family)